MFNTALAPLEHRSAIGPMSVSLAHRGPDSDGLFEQPYLALAVRRLSIIDLETGDQPLSNESGDITLVYNGEIYNYRELRKDLLERGHQFKTRSDGEVIAHLYEDLGENFLRELSGMFAIALWDETRKKLLLARDRAGEKPLYYWRRGDTFVFGSEIKALLKHPAVGRETDPEAIKQYMFYGYVPAPRSIFSGIRKLPAGCRLTIQNGADHIEPYWQLKDFQRAPGAPRNDFGSVVAPLRSRLREAALSRLVSDVPLGVFLSGGVDSSTLVALMSDLAPGQVTTFSVVFTDRSYNEEPYSTLVARRFRTRHHMLRADSAALLRGLQAISAHLDEPLADPAIIPTYLLSRFAREHVKVALSGEGSDELFGGYPTYIGDVLVPYYRRLPSRWREIVHERLQPLLPATSGAAPIGIFVERFLRHADKPPAERHQAWFGITSPEQMERLFPFSGGLAVRDAIVEPLDSVLAGARFESPLAQSLYLDFCLYLSDNLLVKIDRASMASSLELRTPFLDHRLIQFAASLPVSMKVRGFELKRVLKKAVAPWLPRRIVYRQKRGFSVPTARLLRRELRPLAEEMLSERRLRLEGTYDVGFVRRMLDLHQSGKRDFRKPLWALLCFELWREHWGLS